MNEDVIVNLDNALNSLESLVDILTDLHDTLVEMNQEMEHNLTELSYIKAESIRDSLLEDGIVV